MTVEGGEEAGDASSRGRARERRVPFLLFSKRNPSKTEKKRRLASLKLRVQLFNLGGRVKSGKKLQLDALENRPSRELMRGGDEQPCFLCEPSPRR